MMLLGMASIGGVTPISLFVLVLAVAAVTSLPPARRSSGSPG